MSVHMWILTKLAYSKSILNILNISNKPRLLICEFFIKLPFATDFAFLWVYFAAKLNAQLFSLARAKYFLFILRKNECIKTVLYMTYLQIMLHVRWVWIIPSAKIVFKKNYIVCCLRFHRWISACRNMFPTIELPYTGNMEECLEKHIINLLKTMHNTYKVILQ